MENIRRDLGRFTKDTGHSLNWLANASGVEQGSLSRFSRGVQKGLRGETVERIWPFLYGPKRPMKDDRRLSPRRQSSRRGSDAGGEDRRQHERRSDEKEVA